MKILLSLLIVFSVTLGVAQDIYSYQEYGLQKEASIVVENDYSADVFSYTPQGIVKPETIELNSLGETDVYSYTDVGKVKTATYQDTYNGFNEYAYSSYGKQKTRAYERTATGNLNAYHYTPEGLPVLTATIEANPLGGADVYSFNEYGAKVKSLTIK